MTSNSATATAPLTFTSAWESLDQYRCPNWFRDAKFGVWAHWGPQAVPMIGDWYARNIYIQDSPMAAHHRRVYGHPSKVGYKDIIQLWKAERFDPERLIDLYQTNGAKYFTACGVHHDNFDCWDSTHHPWNSVKVGPGKDIVGMWEKAARAAGLRFGITEHHGRTYNWLNTSKGADTYGPYAGVPYDGCDPAFQDLYHPPHEDTSASYPKNPTPEVIQDYLQRMLDLIDRYNPDLLYSDGGIPFGEVGRQMLAHFYNRNIERHEGRLEAVYALKDPTRHNDTHLGDYREGVGVLDMERGVVDSIHPNPWQTDTCIGDWYYKTQAIYKKPSEIIHTLADIVSKNGNLLLNFPPRPDGTLDEEEEWTLGQIGQWLRVNGEAIYGTRPWTRFGEGDTTLAAGAFAEKENRVFTSADFRFTTRGQTLYAIALGWPEAEANWNITSLASQDVKEVTLLGTDEPITWSVNPEGLTIETPDRRPCDVAYSLKITL